MFYQNIPSEGTIDVGVRLQHAFDYMHKADPQWNWLGMPLSGYSNFTPRFQSLHLEMMGVSSHVFFHGVSGTPEPKLFNWDGEPVVQRGYDYSVDSQKYAGMWAGIQTLRHGLQKPPARETSASHVSARGAVSRHKQQLYTYSAYDVADFVANGESAFMIADQRTGLYTHRYAPTSWDGPVPVLDPGVVVADPEMYFSGRAYQVDLPHLHKWDSFWAPVKFVGQTLGPVPIVDVPILGHSPYPGIFCGDRLMSLTESSLHIRNYVWTPGNLLREIDLNLSFQVDVNPEATPRPDGSGTDIFRVLYRSDVHMTYCYTLPVPVPGHNGLAGWAEWFSADYSHEWFANERNFPLTTPITPDVRADERRFFGLAGRIADNHRLLSERLGDVRPASMLSFADAMSASRTTATNYIETIVEGKELFELIPDLVSLVSNFINKKYRRDLYSSLSLGDLLANSNLWTRFGASPTLSNAEDIVASSRRIGSAMTALQSAGTFHGQFRYDHSVFDEYNLHVRSTVRVRGASDELMLKLLRLDSLGLLPSTARFWDTTQWSWLLDYGTQIGSRSEILDSVFLGVLRGVHYATHSYTLRRPLGTQAKAFHLTASSTAESVHYFRESSAFVPMIFDNGPYDFHQTNGVSLAQASIVVSILWNLLRGK